MRRLALFDKGFRPFFILAALASVVYLPAWLGVFWGWWVPPGSWRPSAWHGHEMLFGYTAAVLAGFLLTAVSQWTGRETAEGGALAGLCVVWLAGRVAVLMGGILPGWVIAVADLAFLPAVAFAVGRALIVSGNARNFPFIALLISFWGGNLWMHLSSVGVVSGGVSSALWVSVDVMMVIALIISGRIIPLFTGNAIDQTTGSWPWVDRALVGLVGGYLVSAYAVPIGAVGGALPEVRAIMGLAVAVAIFVRMIPWGGQYTWDAPILWVLHLGHAWIGVGFLLRGLDAVGLVVPMASLHALTAGAIGTLTIAMMTRVARGHTGRALTVSWPTALTYVAVIAAGVLRVVGSVVPAWYLGSMWASGLLWAAAFAVYLAIYTPMLVAPRVDAPMAGVRD
jgi:uncharacterized protein involved in response to NO